MRINITNEAFTQYCKDNFLDATALVNNLVYHWIEDKLCREKVYTNVPEQIPAIRTRKPRVTKLPYIGPTDDNDVVFPDSFKCTTIEMPETSE